MKLFRMFKNLVRQYFLIGLIVVVPFVVTLFVLFAFVTFLDGILEIQKNHFLFVIPARFHPSRILGFPIPGLGLLFTFFFILLIGVLSRNYFGRVMIRWGDATVARIPGVRWLYKIVKQVVETLSRDKSQQFSRVVMIEYPRKGLYTLAFVTGEAMGEVQRRTSEKVLNLFIPTTPNPTSGFYIMIPDKDAIKLDLSIEDAFKLIVSGGMVSPDDRGVSTAPNAS